jgi:hypothetical protein
MLTNTTSVHYVDFNKRLDGMLAKFRCIAICGINETSEY